MAGGVSGYYKVTQAGHALRGDVPPAYALDLRGTGITHGLNRCPKDFGGRSS